LGLVIVKKKVKEFGLSDEEEYEGAEFGDQDNLLNTIYIPKKLI
jgi:hypothetical protein